MPEVLQKYSTVTGDRLKHPADGDWLMVRRTYDGWGYSPLRQITPDNVSRLEPVVVVFDRRHQRPRSDADREQRRDVRRDARQSGDRDRRAHGTLLWRYRNTPDPDVVQLHPTSRGVALYRRQSVLRRGEAVLVALDARTGKAAWTAKVADNRKGYYMSLAPLVADGKVMVGASGGELGVRGFVAAFDADTGKELWRTFTVPAPGEPGSETWPKGDQWKTGGGSIWVTGNYDPETNLAFWGTGNGGPWMGDQRPGDNLYTSSTIAIDVATGADQGLSPVPPERIVGLGRSVAADPRRLSAQRPNGQGTDRRRARRLPVVPRAHRRRRSSSSKASRT